MAAPGRYVHFVSRLAIASLFFIAFAGKVGAYDFLVGLSGKLGIPFAAYLMPVAMAFDLLGGLALVFNRKVWLVSLLLAAYVAFVTPFFHFNWAGAPDAYQEAVNVFENLAVIGGLLALYLLDPSRPEKWKQAGL